MRTDEAQAIAERLGELLNISPLEIQLTEPAAPKNGEGVDVLIKADQYAFAVKIKRSPTTANLHLAAQEVRRYVEQSDAPLLPLIVVPYLGETGRRVCEEAGVNWLDLSGNARIVAPRLNISWIGRPNRFKYEADSKSVFAPKLVRLVRWFLMNPQAPISQRELARATGLDEGYVSHAVGRMREAGYVVRDERKLVQLRHPDLLLEDWRQAYDFSKHRVLRGHVVARSGEALTHQLAEALESHGQEYAATGLSAAWMMDHFAGFRLATLYVREEPSKELLAELGFREEPRGANTWLIVPKDEGVFQGAAPYEDVRCVHPVQAYVDLQALPERAEEAAEHLHQRILKSFIHA